MKEIYSRDCLSIWVGGPSLQFYAGLFFAPYTFSRRSRALIRAQKGKIRVLVRIAYSDTTPRAACGNSGFQRCKVEPQPYTYFTPPPRTNAISRSTIGAVMSGSARRTTRQPASAASKYFSRSARKPAARLCRPPPAM